MSTVDYNSVSNKYTKLKDVFLSADYVKAEYIEELSVKLSALNETVTTNLNVRLTVNDISADENNNINLSALRPAPGEGDVYKEYFDSPITFLTDDEKLTKELVAINNDTAVYSLLNATHYILAGTNNGLYYSADKGKTWEQSNTLNDVLVKNLKTYNNRFYACTNEGLYESLNGTTWHIYSDPMAGARLSLERDNITDIIQFKKAQSKITIATTSTGYIKFFNESTKDNPRYFILNNNNYNIRTIIEHKDYIYIADEFYVYKISKQTILDAIRQPNQSMAIEAPIFDITSIRNNSINDIAIINDVLYVCTSNNGILYSTDFSTFTKIIDTNNVARNLSDTNNFDYIKIANNKIYAAAISKQTIYIFDSASVVPTVKPLLLNNVTSIFDFIFIDNYYMLLGTNAGVYHIQQMDDITLVKDKIITQTQLDTVITEINETFNNEIDECEKIATFKSNHLALGNGTYDYELNKHDNVIALGTNIECDNDNDIAIGNKLKLTNENSIVIGNNITVDKPDTTILATTTNNEYIKLILTLDNNDDLSGKPYFILKTNNNEQIKEISLSGHTHSINDIIDLQDNIDYISSEIEIINDNIYNITNDIEEISSYFIFQTYDSFSQITSDHATVFANVETIDNHIKSALEPYEKLFNGVSETYATKKELTATYATKTELTSTYATKNQLATDYVAKTQLTSTYATKTDVTDQLKSYATKTDVTDQLKSYATKTYLADNYYSKSDIDTKLENINNGSGGNTGGNPSSAITNTSTVIPADSVIYNQSRNIGEIFFTLNKEEVGEKVENPNDPRLDKIDVSLINSYIAKGLFVINETNFKGAIQCDGKMYVPYDTDGNKQVDVIFSDLITAMENGSILSVGFTEYETLYEANNGIVGVFGWNDGIIRVPSLIARDGNGVFLQTSMLTADIANLYKAPGLPSISGEFGGLLHEGAKHFSFTGPFRRPDDVKTGANGGGDYRPYNRVTFDAARCNPVYGRSNTVQPAAVTYIPMIQICNFTILAKNDTNTTAIATVADETTNTRITQLESEIETLKEQINLLINK